jgi:hypothetical protein
MTARSFRWPLLAGVFWLASFPARSLPAFSFATEDALATWTAKANVVLGFTPDGLENNGAARLTADPSQNSFAWIRHSLPEEDFAGAKGIQLAYRAAERVDGTMEVRLVKIRDGGTRTVYVGRLGQLGRSGGEWQRGYAELEAMDHLLGPAEPPIPGRLGPTWILLVAISVPGTAQGKLTVDVDEIRFLGGEEADAAATIARREQREAMLRPEDQLPGNHPRIVFRPERIQALRAADEPGSERAIARGAFLATMRRLAESYDAKNPLAKSLETRIDPKLTGDAKRLGFGVQLRREAGTIEYLAAAWQLTGEQRFADLGVTALVQAATTITPDEPLLIDGGRRMLKSFYPRSLALAYDWLYDAMAPEQRHAVRRELVAHILLIDGEARQAGWGRRPLNRVWNFAPGIMSAMGLCVLAVEGETLLGEHVLLFDARRYLRDYLTLGIDRDGCGHEGPNYLAYGLDSACYFMTALRNSGRGDLLLETNLQLTPPWLVAETLPGGGRWNNLSDCSHGQGRSAILMFLSGRLAEFARQEPAITGRQTPMTLTAPLGHLVQFSEVPGERPLSYGALAGLMGWVWHEGPGRKDIAKADPGTQLDQILFYQPCKPIVDPAKVMADGQLLHGRGLAVSRTGYDGQELHFAVEAGPHATGHDQSDKGSFTLRAYGADLAIDSGYGNDSDPLAGGSSYAHNIVLVDGQGQPLPNHNQSDGWITGYHHGPLADWIRVDALPAWTLRRGRDGEPLRTGTMRRADRQFLLVRPQEGIPPYLVVYDDIIKDDQPHDYTWQWHIPPTQRFDVVRTPWQTRPWQMQGEALTTPTKAKPGSATMVLSVPAAGRYVLYGLVRAAGPEPAKSDSFFVSIDDGEALTWDLGGRGPWGWSPVRDRGDKEPRVFDLAAGKHTILLKSREPQAEWASWLLLPADQPAPASPDAVPPNSIRVPIDDVVMGTPSFQRIPITESEQPTAWLDVFPVHPSGGRVVTDWFRTSTEGSHPRLQWTVRATLPRLLAVLVPRTDGVPQPVVRPLQTDSAVGAEIRWGEWTDQIVFTDGEASIGDLNINGAACLLRTRSTKLVDWALHDGASLEWQGRKLVESRPPTGVSTSR